MKKLKKLNKGFTLVELLIVIAIIGVLSALLMVNFIGVRQRARDAQRKSEVRQMQSAFELYRADNGTYPAFGTDASPIYGWAWPISLNLNKNGVTYMATIPPGINTGGDSCKGYLYAGNANSYTLFTLLENTSDSEVLAAKSAPSYAPTGSSSDGYKTFRVTGGTCANYTFNYWVNNP